jgi:Flp pilus assembly protein TadB
MNERHIIYSLIAALIGVLLVTPMFLLGSAIMFAAVLGGATLFILSLKARHDETRTK